jgi:DNA-binding beta-propeller fold protein YncE
MSDERIRHLLLNGIAGWQAALLDGAVLADDSAVLADDGAVLRLQPLAGSGRPLVDPSGSYGGLVSPISVAVDFDDNIYILDSEGPVIKRFDRCSETFSTLPCIGGSGSGYRQFSNPQGIAISRFADLYVADTGNARVQVFSLKGFVLRSVWGPLKITRDGTGTVKVEPVGPGFPPPPSAGDECESAAVFPPGTWQPWDIAILKTERVLVSDYANGLIHVFDSCGQWQTSFDGTAGGGTALANPTRIALDSRCRIYVVQDGQDFVTILDSEGKFLGIVSSPEELKGRFCPVAVAVDINGNLCVSDCFTGNVLQYAPSSANTDPCVMAAG